MMFLDCVLAEAKLCLLLGLASLMGKLGTLALVRLQWESQVPLPW